MKLKQILNEISGSWILNIQINPSSKSLSNFQVAVDQMTRPGFKPIYSKDSIVVYTHDKKQLNNFISYLRMYSKKNPGFILSGSIESSRKYTSNFEDVEFDKKEIKF